MAVTGLISLNQGIYLTMGSNIGSCVVAIIAGLTSGLNAKRTALIHLLFNCFGVFIFLIAAWIMHLVTSGGLNYGIIFERMFPGAPQLQLAMFHTIFNCVTVCIILPLTDYLVNLVVKILPEKNRVDEALQKGQPHFHFVDEQMLRTPAIAVNQVKLEIENMAAVSIHNFNLAMDIISTVNFDKMDEFNENEKQLNYLNRNLIPYIVHLNNLPISEEDNRYLATAIRTIGDLERVGDYAVNLTEYAELLKNFNEKFSNDLLFEVEQLREYSYAESTTPAPQDVPILTMVDTLHEYDDGNISVTVSLYRGFDSDIYVADVVLSSPTQLRTAFAKDAYGRNIREQPSEIAERLGAILAINGDYYGAQERGFVLRNGVIYRTTRAKDQEELAVYADGSFKIVNRKNVRLQTLLDAGAVQVFSFGPALVEDGEISVQQSELRGKDKTRNPRTAIGHVDGLHYVFVVADGRTDTSDGLTILELAGVMQHLGAETAYNLDGGGSSCMVFDGRVVNVPTTTGANSKEREVSDIVYIGY